MIEQSSVPSVFVLMANKAQNTYIRVLNVFLILYYLILNRKVLNEALHGIGPLSIMLDFEQGI